MKNLVPKSLAKQKGIFYKNVAWMDILVFLFLFGFSAGISFGIIIIEWWIRIVIALSITLFLSIFLLSYSKINDCRQYKVWVFRFKFKVSPKKYKGKETQELNPYLQIKNGAILTKKPKDGPSQYLKMVKIRGLDISSLDELEVNIKLEQFHSFLVQQKRGFSLAKVNEKYVLGPQIQNLIKMKSQNKNEYDEAIISEKEYKSKIFQQNNQIEMIEKPDKFLKANPLQANFYLILYDTNLNNLSERVQDSINDLEAIGLFANEVDVYKSINIIKNIYNPIEEDISKEIIDANKEKLDEIFHFDELSFKKDYIEINEQLLLSFQAVTDYPIEIDNYWLSHIFLSTNANIILNAKQINTSTASMLINKAIVNSASNEFNEKKQLEKMQFNAINEGFKQMAQDIVRKNQVVFSTNILFLNYDIDKYSIIKTNRQLEKIFAAKNIRINRLKFRQFEALNSFLPKSSDNLIKHIGREMPSRTLANGYPFLSNVIVDDKGMPLGTNWLQDPFIFDPFVLDQQRKNHNMMIIGSSGSGKSYLMKKFINWFCLTNKKVYILDVEREYQNITNYYDGDWIDIGSGTAGRINPLEIFVVENDLPKDIIANHILMLETFFQILFPEIRPNCLRYLTSIIKDFYYHLNFHKKNFDKLTSKDYPIFDDLYKYINSKNNKLINQYHKDDVQYVNELLRSELISDGKLAFLYNGKSTIYTTKRIACFDIHSLFEKNNNRITQTQLFLALNYIQKEVKDNDYTKEPIIIVIDEAHLLIDQENPVGLDFVYQMVKRIRKRNGSIIIITQNPDDFNANEVVSKKTKAILNNTQYSFFFNLSPNNIKDLTEMYKSYGSGLSEDERLYIAKARRGEALFFVSGFDRHKLKIVVSQKEKESF